MGDTQREVEKGKVTHIRKSSKRPFHLIKWQSPEDWGRRNRNWKGRLTSPGNWTLLGGGRDGGSGREAKHMGGLCHFDPSGILRQNLPINGPLSVWPEMWEPASSQDPVAMLPSMMGLLFCSLELTTLNELQRAHFHPLRRSHLGKQPANKCNLQGSPQYSTAPSICAQIALELPYPRGHNTFHAQFVPGDRSSVCLPTAHLRLPTSTFCWTLQPWVSPISPAWVFKPWQECRIKHVADVSRVKGLLLICSFSDSFTLSSISDEFLFHHPTRSEGFSLSIWPTPASHKCQEPESQFPKETG